MKRPTTAKDEIRRAMQHLYRLASDSLSGRKLSSAERRYYSEHLDTWQERMFHLSMAILCEARSLKRLAQNVALAHATKLPTEQVVNLLLRSPDLDPNLECALDCWEVDRELAYEQFGDKFCFRPPEEPDRGKQ